MTYEQIIKSHPEISTEYLAVLTALVVGDTPVLDDELIGRIHDEVLDPMELLSAAQDVVKAVWKVTGRFDIDYCNGAFRSVMKTYTDHIGAELNEAPLKLVEEVIAGLFSLYSRVQTVSLKI